MDNLTNRQKIILKAIVDEYIKTAKPVGSSHILNCLSIKISPALIRNECIVLEKKKLVQKLHLSSGRLPSTKGYRYYVDNLITKNDKDIDPIKIRIEKIFYKRDLEINEILEKTGEIISEMTNLTALIIDSSSNSKKLLVKKLDLLPIDDNKAVVIIVLSNGHIENKIFNFSTISLTDLQLSVSIFNERLQNTPVNEIYQKFQLIYPILEKQVKKCEIFLKEFIATFTNITKIKKTTHGIQYMLKNPEFDNSTTIKNAIKIIESISSFEYFQKMSQINENQKINSNGIIVKIGEEFNNKDMDDISIISTNYKSNNYDTKTKFALVGPKRIEYDKILKLLEWVSKKLLNYTNKKEDNDEQKSTK